MTSHIWPIHTASKITYRHALLFENSFSSFNLSRTTPVGKAKMAEVPSVPTEGTDSEVWPSTTYDHASDLFEKNVPVCFKGPGRTPEKVEELSFRILLGFDREKQAKASEFHHQMLF